MMKRLTLALAAASALLIAGCGTDDGDAKETVTVTSSPASTATVPGKALTPEKSKARDLRSTAENFARDGLESETTGSPTFKEMMDIYAVPMCGEILNGFADAFGPGESDGDFTIADVVSVVEDGDRGTIVTREPGGEDETTHWLFDGTSWRFTCEGLFDETE